MSAARPSEGAQRRSPEGAGSAGVAARPRVRPSGREAPGSLAAAVDMRGRPLHDLRISVTDRCNFRCSYCMPREVFGRDHVFLPQRELLSFEEIAQIAAAAAALGVEKLRLTGGEPLLRRDLPRLVALLSALRTPAGIPLDLTLTTNGTLLARQAAALQQAGLRRVSVSLDALDPQIFARLSDAGVPVDQVLAGIDAALDAGLAPVKVNMVVRRGLNEDQILPMARHFRHRAGVVLRFIEYMDVGATNGWQRGDVVSGEEILRRLGEYDALEPVPGQYRGEVAQRWRYADGSGEIGLITSVSRPFCGDCTRLRLSPEGQVYTCLFASAGHDLRSLLRGGADQVALQRRLGEIWGGRADRYSEQRAAQVQPVAGRIEMSYIGG